MNTQSIAALDELDRARNLVWLLSMTTREDNGRDGDQAAIAEVCETILSRLDGVGVAIRAEADR